MFSTFTHVMSRDTHSEPGLPMEEVSCSVCMTTFTDPKQLPCLLSFCLHCLNEWLRTSGRHNILTCPECRKESRVLSSGNLKDLPTNFRINSLLDVLAIKECNTTGIKCGNCQGHPTEAFRKISVPQWKFSWLGN